MSEIGSDGAPPEEWSYAEEVFGRAADPAVRESLQLALERDREAWQQRARFVRRFDALKKYLIEIVEDFTKKFFVLFENDVSQLKSSKRIETKVDELGAKIDALIADLRTVGPEIGRVRGELATLRDSQAAAMTQASAERLERLAAERRITATEAIVEAMRKDVSASGQHAAVGEAMGRLALDSVHEKDDEKKVELELKRVAAEGRWKTWHTIVGLIVGLVLLAAGVVAAIVQAHYGAAGVHIPPPAPPAGQEHHQ